MRLVLQIKKRCSCQVLQKIESYPLVMTFQCTSASTPDFSSLCLTRPPMTMKCATCVGNADAEEYLFTCHHTQRCETQMAQNFRIEWLLMYRKKRVGRLTFHTSAWMLLLVDQTWRLSAWRVRLNSQTGESWACPCVAQGTSF